MQHASGLQSIPMSSLSTRGVAAVGRAVLAATLLLPLLAAPARAGVLVVDDNGPADFTTIAQALNAAAEGDIVLVKAGSYTSFGDIPSINGKGLTLVGDAGGTPHLVGLSVLNVPAGSRVTVRNLSFDTANAFVASPAPRVFVQNCAGAVSFEECFVPGRNAVHGFQFQSATPGAPAAVIENSAGVAFERCTLTGGSGAASFMISIFVSVTSAGGPAITLAGGTLSLDGCSVTGGAGGTDPVFHSDATLPQMAGAGVLVTSGTLRVSGGTLAGGLGPAGASAAAPEAGAGGPALHLASASAAAITRGATLAQAPGGALIEGGVAPSGPGSLVAPGAALTALPGSARTHIVNGVLREGEPGLTKISGEPGDLVLVTLSLRTGFVSAGSKGVVLVDLPFLLTFSLGALPAGGVLDIPFLAPGLGIPGLQGVQIAEQSWLKSTGGEIVLSSQSTLVVVSAAL